MLGSPPFCGLKMQHPVVSRSVFTRLASWPATLAPQLSHLTFHFRCSPLLPSTPRGFSREFLRIARRPGCALGGVQGACQFPPTSSLLPLASPPSGLAAEKGPELAAAGGKPRAGRPPSHCTSRLRGGVGYGCVHTYNRHFG